MPDKISRRLNSVTTFATCSTCGKRAFLKILSGEAESAAAEARRVFDVAASVHRQFPPDSEFATAEPLHFDGPLVVFASVAGKSPVSALRDSPIDQACRLSASLGHWLALFHSEGQSSLPVLENLLAERIDGLRLRWTRLPEPPQLALSALRHLENVNSPAGRRCVRQHGDAKPDNFLLEGGRLFGIDIDGQHLASPENDLAQLDLQVRICLSPSLGRVDLKRIHRLCSALTDGYRAVADLDAALLQRHRLLYLLTFWASSREGMALKRWYFDRIFTRIARTLLEVAPE